MHFHIRVEFEATHSSGCKWSLTGIAELTQPGSQVRIGRLQEQLQDHQVENNLFNEEYESQK